MSIGSLAELEYILSLATQLGIIASQDSATLKRLHGEANKTTWGLYRSLVRCVHRKRATPNPR